jgi:chromosome partitioning protein
VKGATISVVNFKGGSTKTTTAFNLAQGLTLRGRRVLLVDLDPQGSATTLTGLLPAAEVLEEHTVGPVTYPPLSEAPKDLRYAVQSTYWDGLDLIPAAPQLFNAEIFLPMHSRDPDIAWWDIINRAIDPLREDYDVIIFDTAPALSYLAVNAVIASDGLLMPIPPENLDYASSVAFWSLLSETIGALKRNRGYEKDFAFMRVLLSRVDSQLFSATVVRDWIIRTYGPYVLPVEIPKSPVSTVGAVQFQTVYDIARYEGSMKTYAKIRDAYDRFVEMIDQSIVTSVWGVNSK